MHISHDLENCYDGPIPRRQVACPKAVYHYALSEIMARIKRRRWHVPAAAVFVDPYLRRWDQDLRAFSRMSRPSAR